MAKKLYTVDYTDESYPQVVEATEVERGVTLLEAKDELYRWAAGQAEHYRMIARAALAARKEDVEAGSIYTTRATLTAKRERAQAKVEPRAERTPEELDTCFDLLAS